MSTVTDFEPRKYQSQILEQSTLLIKQHKNAIIELDCGLGKRYLQLSLITNKFKNSKILLLLQASTSLYETYNYMKKYAPNDDISMIDSRIPSALRERRLKENRVILCLPQTLANTLKKYPNAILNTDLVLINEIDQIIRRMARQEALKIPYPALFRHFSGKSIIGMSGTLRDDHYILDQSQLVIRKELETISGIIPNSSVITMDSLSQTDLKEHIKISNIIPTAVNDVRISLISMELELYLDEAKEKVFSRLKEEDPFLYADAKKDFSKLFGPLPLEPDLIKKFHSGYLTRKYLWAMSGKKSAIHLIRYGLDDKYIWKNVPVIPGKFMVAKDIVSKQKKSVILCSYLDTVNTMNELLTKAGFKTIIISGQVTQANRISNLEYFRNTDEQIIAILSNVGERDLDIPEAELLLIFDLINTTKTVYQKLKRSRGGNCRILYYADTNEVKKAKNVINKIAEKYPWSTNLLASENYEIN